MTPMRFTRRDWLSGLAVAAGPPALAQTVHEEIRAAANTAPLAMQFRGGNARECREWQQAFSAQLGVLLGPHQPPADWKTTVANRVRLPDHVREELILSAPGHRDLPVHLLIPDATSKRAGILALHGHGRFGHDAVAGVESSPERQKDIAALNYDYGRQLVRQGYVVAAPCFTPFGRRLDDPKAYRGDDPCAVTFVRMQLFGKVLMAENLRDALWALEHLGRHPSVDSQRLGCVGLSYGGRMAMLASALSPKIRVAVISGALNLMQERVLGRYSCGAQVIPGLLKYGDVPEIASLIAPRPCLWEVGLQDALMVKDRIEPSLGRMARAWAAFAAPGALQVDYFQGGHRWNGVKAYPLLSKALNDAGPAAA